MHAKLKSGLVNAALMTMTIAAAIAVGSVAPKLYQQWQGNSRSGNFSEHLANQPQRLTLYGTTSCPYCAKARAFLTKANIPFNDRIVDVSKDAEALYTKLNMNSVPVLVSENKLIVGFNEKDYAALAGTTK